MWSNHVGRNLPALPHPSSHQLQYSSTPGRAAQVFFHKTEPRRRFWLQKVGTQPSIYSQKCLSGKCHPGWPRAGQCVPGEGLSWALLAPEYHWHHLYAPSKDKGKDRALVGNTLPGCNSSCIAALCRALATGNFFFPLAFVCAATRLNRNSVFPVQLAVLAEANSPVTKASFPVQSPAPGKEQCQHWYLLTLIRSP